MVDLVERTESLEVELAATLHLLGQRTTPTARSATSSPPFPPPASPKSSSSACAIAAGTTKPSAPSTPEPLSASTSSWTSADSATCTATAAARRSCRVHRAPRLRNTSLRRPRPDWTTAEAGVLADYQAAIDSAYAASAKIAASSAPEAASSALYLLPLATRIRCLFKMDFAEAQYISELRSGPAGHFSYRRVAWEMYLALERQHPTLAKHIRATDFTQPIDLLQR